MGRNCKLTPELTEEICKLIEKGADKKTAAHCAGIGETTFYAWMDKGKQQKNGKYQEFRESIKKAESILKKKHEIKIIESKSWTSSAWWLERRYPNEYKKIDHIEHTGKIDIELFKKYLEKEDDDK